MAEEHGIDADKPWRRLSQKHHDLLLYAKGAGRVHVRYRNRYGRTRSYHAQYEGIVPYLQRRHSEADSDSQREQAEGYMRARPARPVTGRPSRSPWASRWMRTRSTTSAPCPSVTPPTCSPPWRLSERDRIVAERVIKEVNAPMGFLRDVGLDYLGSARSAATLAGEAQRIRLASQIGSGLVGVLYVLDEPSIGCTSGTTAGSWTRCSGCATSATPCWWWSTTRRPSAPPTTSSTSGRARGARRRDRPRDRSAS